MPISLRRAHLISASIIGAFLVVHMINHLVGLAGQNYHVAYMALARQYYRYPGIEPCLLLLIVWQVGSGLWMVARTWRDKHGGVAWLQALSGATLGLFLPIHVGAVLYGRCVLGLDTDFRFAAAGFHVPPWSWFFAPYYALAITSMFAHVGCAFYWNLGDDWVAARGPILATLVAVGMAFGVLIDLSLAGMLYPVDISPAYRASYTGGS
jgi:hypothetical protein